MFGYGMPCGTCFANYSGAGGGCAMPAAAHTAAPAAKAESSCGCGGCGWGSSLIPLFILVGLLALFIPGGFFFILILILLLILTCCCGACGGRR